jgi:hypothetical protein
MKLSVMVLILSALTANLGNAAENQPGRRGCTFGKENYSFGHPRQN